MEQYDTGKKKRGINVLVLTARCREIMKVLFEADSTLAAAASAASMVSFGKPFRASLFAS
jgi:hypothetical protein